MTKFFSSPKSCVATAQPAGRQTENSSTGVRSTAQLRAIGSLPDPLHPTRVMSETATIIGRRILCIRCSVDESDRKIHALNAFFPRFVAEDDLFLFYVYDHCIAFMDFSLDEKKREFVENRILNQALQWTGAIERI